MKIKVLKGISLMYAHDKRMLKALGTYFMLKDIETSSCIDLDNAIKPLAQYCNMSRRSFYNRLHLLVEKKLASWCKESQRLTLISYRQLADDCGIKRLYFHHIHKPDNFRFDYILEALYFKEKQKECNDALYYRLKRSPELHSLLKEIVTGSNRSRFVAREDLLTSQILSFSTSNYDEDERYYLHQLNADLNLSLRHLSHAFGYNPDTAEVMQQLKQGQIDDETAATLTKQYKGISSAAYKRKRLKALRVIDIEKRQYNSPIRVRKSINGTVQWSTKERNTMLIMPDKVTFNPRFF